MKKVAKYKLERVLVLLPSSEVNTFLFFFGMVLQCLQNAFKNTPPIYQANIHHRWAKTGARLTKYLKSKTVWNLRKS